VLPHSDLEVVGKTFSTDMVIAAHAIAWEPLCLPCAKFESFLRFQITR